MNKDLSSSDNSSVGQSAGVPEDKQAEVKQNVPQQNSDASGVVFDAPYQEDDHKQAAPPQNLPTQENEKSAEEESGKTIEIPDTGVATKKVEQELAPEKPAPIIKPEEKTRVAPEQKKPEEQSLEEQFEAAAPTQAQEQKGVPEIKPEEPSLEEQLDATTPAETTKEIPETKPVPEKPAHVMKEVPAMKAEKIPLAGQEVKQTPGERILSHRDTIKVPVAKKTIPGDPLFAAKVLEQQKTPVIRSDQPTTPTVERKPLTPGAQKAPVVRTYKSDVAAALKKGKTSMTDLVMAEQKKRGVQTEGKAKSKKNISVIILSIVLIIAGASALAWVGGYKFRLQTTPSGGTSINIPSLIFTEVKGEINITEMADEAVREAIQNEIISTNIRLDSIKNVFFTEDAIIQTQEGMQEYKSVVETSPFFEAADISLPGRLDRSLDDEFMFGIHMFNGNQPFVILKTSYFENAFSGMLEWEPTMAEDILPIFAYTGTTTIYKTPFQDEVIKNRDLRVLKNGAGKNELLYMFLDKETAIITTNLSTLDEVILRINKRKAKE